MSHVQEIPLFRHHHDEVLEQIKSAVNTVLDSRHYILGHQVSRFEGLFADYCETSDCVSVASGTDALELSLRALGIGPGHEVALVANAGFYGSLATYNVGAKPNYIEIDDLSLTMCPRSLQNRITPSTKAIIATHLYGRMANMPGILEIANHCGLPVIEDCAQAHGAALNGRKAGSLGTLGCFSFYPTKNLGAIGDGGAITTSDRSLASNLRQLRQYGWEPKYRIEKPGGRNSRLDEIQAAVLTVKLERLDEWNTRRREIAQHYWAQLKDVYRMMTAPGGEDYVAHLLVLRNANRDQLRAALFDNGIQTDIHYPIPDYKQPAHPDEFAPPLRITDGSCRSVFTVPCFPGLTEKEVQRITNVIKDSGLCT